MRGEYIKPYWTHEIQAELPPRARRIHDPMSDLGVHGGTTSACAENTDVYHNSLERVRNYLRVRGEYPK